MPLYSQFDVSCCIPLPQETEQSEFKLQADQVGHDCVLHDSFRVRLEDPLPKERSS